MPSVSMTRRAVASVANTESWPASWIHHTRSIDAIVISAQPSQGLNSAPAIAIKNSTVSRTASASSQLVA